MFSFGLTEKQVMTVNLHQMNTAQARDWLSQKVSGAPKEIREIEVIHGYHGGTALKNMVQKSFRHPRVKGKILTGNPGSTILILR